MCIELEIDEYNDTELKFVVIQANKLGECLNMMQQQGYENICISSAHGWKKGMSIEFLTKLEWVKGVWVVDDEMDFSPINNCMNLEFLSINYSKNSKGKINFKNLPKLKALCINYYTPINIENIEALVNLTYMYFSRWPFKDLVNISGNSKLQNLKLDFARLKNLNGIENFKQLTSLKIYSAPNLKSIDQIEPLALILKNVYFELCPNIDSYKAVNNMNNIESFYIARSSPIHSAQFLKNTPNLRYAYIGVEVNDKDIQVLKDKGIEYKKFKAY